MISTLIWRPTGFQSHGARRSFARSARREPASVEPSEQRRCSCSVHNADKLLPALPQKVRTLLEQARDVDLATAIFRNRVINPDHYHDDEQVQVNDSRSNHSSTNKTTLAACAIEKQRHHYGSGFIGLLPQVAQLWRKEKNDCRGEQSHPASVRNPLRYRHPQTETRSLRRISQAVRRAAPRTSQPADVLHEVQRHKPTYDQTLVREGARAAYPFKDYAREAERTVSRHGSYAWAMAHLDHTELNLVLCDSRTGQPLGKCWLTLLILSHPRRIAAYYLTFDPPSYRSCLAVLRLCVKRYGRLPTAITVDGGPEFASVYFEQLLALYRVRKHQRPAAEPRFGSPQETLVWYAGNRVSLPSARQYPGHTRTTAS